MTKSYVLQAMRVFGFDEMQRLSQLAQIKTASMKKAAGAELIVWDEEGPEERPPSKPVTEQKDNILPFKKNILPPLETSASHENELEHPSEESKNFHSGDFLLWQRELGREAPKNIKTEAAKGYARSTEMYVVKTSTIEGKEKIRFAATNGVLVNKKQA